MLGHIKLNKTLCLLLASAGFASTAIAQKPVPYATPSTNQIPIYPSRTPGILVTRMWDWTTDAWDGNDKPYQQARTVIDQSVAAHHNLAALLGQYKAQAQRRPDDSLALFRWAYTGYQTMLVEKSRIAQFHALDGIQEMFYHTPSAHTYNYARIQFLIGEFYTPNHQAVPVAKRLLKVSKNDYQVQYCLASIYLNDYVHPNFGEVLAICDYLKRLYPKKSSLYTLSGEAYVLRWHQERNPVFAQSVVDNYKKYLKLAPPDDEFRKRAQSIIKEFEPRTKSS